MHLLILHYSRSCRSYHLFLRSIECSTFLVRWLLHNKVWQENFFQWIPLQNLLALLQQSLTNRLELIWFFSKESNCLCKDFSFTILSSHNNSDITQECTRFYFESKDIYWFYNHLFLCKSILGAWASIQRSTGTREDKNLFNCIHSWHMFSQIFLLECNCGSIKKFSEMPVFRFWLFFFSFSSFWIIFGFWGNFFQRLWEIRRIWCLFQAYQLRLGVLYCWGVHISFLIGRNTWKSLNKSTIDEFCLWGTGEELSKGHMKKAGSQF